MVLSRRHFPGRLTIAAAAVPFLGGLALDYYEVAPISSIDLSMGFAAGAIR